MLQAQLRIELRHVKPAIWRRLLVPETVTLAKLHVIVQAAMGWDHGHLHEYEIARQRYGVPDEDERGSGSVIDERRVRLKSFIEDRVRQLVYVYDFGDNWGLRESRLSHRLSRSTGVYQCLCARTGSLRKHYTVPRLLIVDEIGYLPIDRVGANLFFQLISRRYEKGPLILTSNQSFGAWGEVFGDRVIATAILDRVLHHAITLNIRGNSYRLKEKLKAGLIRTEESATAIN